MSLHTDIPLPGEFIEAFLSLHIRDIRRDAGGNKGAIVCDFGHTP